ncbi:MAG: carbohydrate ABC transporter permease, partial [Candidatus Omnitrophica bacterium]|nr:carbohydrate ABC transporter permease [Candidatus Omnitrophota bacterium]
MNGYVIRRKARYFVLHVFLMSIAATCLFPLFYMIRCSVMNNQTIFTDKGLIPSVINVGNYWEAWIGGNFGTFFFNSLLYTTSVVIGIIVISSMAAYAFSRLRFPGRNTFYYMFV